MQPAGIEFAPPRVERSTGPGRHDFEIVADAGDLARAGHGAPRLHDQRDRAAARDRRACSIRSAAATTSSAASSAPTSPTSFRDDPLRIVRGLRFVSQLGFDPDEDTLRQMREWAPQLEHVSGERIGGGLAADGIGELSKLLLGAQPAKALRLARDTGVLLHLLPELGPAIGYDQQSDRQHLTLDEHVFTVVQAAADAGVPLEVRLAALLHDLGKPEAEREGGDHAAIGAADGCTRALAPPLSHEAPGLRRQARARAHVRPAGRAGAGGRAPLPRPARRRARARPARAQGGRSGREDRPRRATANGSRRFRDAGRAGARAAAPARRPRRRRRRPDRSAGFSEGPELGSVLRALLDEVVEEPERNTRELAARRAPRSSRDPLGGARPVRGRLLDARRRRQRGAVRVAQPRPPDRRRRRAGRREPPAALRGGRRRPGAARAQPAGPLDRSSTAPSPAARGEPGDGLWTDEPDLPVLAYAPTACRSRSCARAAARRRWPCCTRAGAACSAGSSPRASRALGGGAQRRDRAGDRAVLLRGRRRGRGAVRGGVRRGRRRTAATSTCWTAAERALRAAGVEEVERVDLCTACNPELFFSHRRDREAARRPGRDRACRLTPSARAYERIRAEVGPDVTVVAATKYVSARGHGRARRGRRRGRGREPRPGPRAQARRATATRSAGTSSATSSRTRRRSSTGSASSSTRSTPSRPRAADGARAGRGEPLRRGVEVGRRARASSARSSPPTAGTSAA